MTQPSLYFMQLQRVQLCFPSTWNAFGWPQTQFMQPP